jgi:DNA-binding XRE family transcriptional regulator
MYRTSYAKHLRQARCDKGISQETMANKLEISQTKYSRFERGLAIPDSNLAAKIADIFEITNSEIFTYSEVSIQRVKHPREGLSFKVKEILNSPIGQFLFVGATISIVSLIDTFVLNFCVGLGDIPEIHTRSASFIFCTATIVYSFYLFRKHKKL